jgi:GNAT superfamily N-acetyltransferase
MNTLDSQSLQAWSQQQLIDLGLARFDVTLTSDGDLHLDWLQVFRSQQGQGLGSTALKRLCDLADHWHMRILLTPSDRNISTGTTSRSRLISFYRRFGFHLNSGRHRDWSTRSQMIRDPKNRLKQ